MTIITLTSDFGLLDPYVGIMKGVILTIAPNVQIIDLTHQIPPQDIDEAAYALQSAIPYFPPGTVHVAVVDPGVGGARRPLLVTRGPAAFVGPDNGLFAFVLQHTDARAWALDRPEHWLPAPSNTFHGRDIFAPVAARVALGASPEELGSLIHDPVHAPLPVPERKGNGEILGHVIHVDRFGNLVTDTPGSWLAGERWTCELKGEAGLIQVEGPSKTYAAVESGRLLLLIGSNGTAEVAIRDGNAAERLRVRRGAKVRFLAS